MKKILSFILALGLASIPVIAESPSFDLSAMTLDELVELRERVSFEIDSRIYGGDSTIGRGEYTVGISIAPGVYEFTATEVEYYDEDSQCYLTVYTVTEDGERSERLSITHIPVSTISIIELKSNEILVIENGSGVLKKAEKTWMPQE